MSFVPQFLNKLTLKRDVCYCLHAIPLLLSPFWSSRVLFRSMLLRIQNTNEEKKRLSVCLIALSNMHSTCRPCDCSYLRSWFPCILPCRYRCMHHLLLCRSRHYDKGWGDTCFPLGNKQNMFVSVSPDYWPNLGTVNTLSNHSSIKPPKRTNKVRLGIRTLQWSTRITAETRIEHSTRLPYLQEK